MPRRKHIELKLDGIAGKLGAEVYSESPGFICLLPIDVHESVVGKGSSVAEAVNNWDLKLQSHLRNADEKDVLVQFVKDHLSASKQMETSLPPKTKVKPVDWSAENKPQHVIDFENQFYSSKKI